MECGKPYLGQLKGRSDDGFQKLYPKTDYPSLSLNSHPDMMRATFGVRNNIDT